MELNEIIKALEDSKYECVAGVLENNEAFMTLKIITNNYIMCCLGPEHKCVLNVNDGYCKAIRCRYQVQEK